MAFRRSFAVVGAAALLIPVWLSTPVLTQQKPEERRKLSRQEQEQIEVLYKLVDEVATANQPAPADVAVTWHNDFMKSLGTSVYAPFTLGVEPGKFTSFPVATYVRIVSRAAAAAPVPPRPDPYAPPDTEVKRPEYAFEDAFFFDQPKDGKVSRAFSVPTGEYDIYVAMKEKPDRRVPKPRTVVLKHSLSVPDLATNLAVSSVIHAQSVEATNQVLTGERQLEQPYNVGGTRITPASSSRLTKAAELSTIFFIYNAGPGANNKPDVDVEYNFHQKTGGTEKFFNKTSPQSFNAETLPPEFNLQAGHQIIAFQSVPLASFPEGDFRLEIKVTDKTNKATLTRDVNFTVAAGS